MYVSYNIFNLCNSYFQFMLALNTINYVIIDMDSQWFKALFKGDYDSIMNYVADYLNYGDFTRNDGDSSDNHSSDNDNDDDSDDEGELFWKKKFICSFDLGLMVHNLAEK